MHYIPAVSLTVPADLRCSLLVRTMAKNAFDLAQVPYTWGYRLILVIDELFMNAVKYGSRSTTDTVELRIYLKKDKVVVEIEDNGTSEAHKVSPKQLQAIMEGHESNEDLSKVSGRGLSMITKAWTDSFIISKSKRGGIKIKIEKYFANCVMEPRNYKHLEFLEQGEHTVSFHLTEELFQEMYAKELQQIFDMLDNHKGHKVIFDFDKLRFLDFRNLGRLIELYARIIASGGKVELANTSDQIELMFADTGFAKVLS